MARASERLTLAMVVMRPAKPADGTTVATTLSSAFESYRAWAPREWSPPVPSAVDIARLSEALARPDVWCVLALDADEVIGHVALSLFTIEDPEPPPAGTINLNEHRGVLLGVCPRPAPPGAGAHSGTRRSGPRATRRALVRVLSDTSQVSHRRRTDRRPETEGLSRRRVASSAENDRPPDGSSTTSALAS